MTDSIIPYSFVPGTKAKAQEVNANFIALAGQITENQTNTNTRISGIETSLTDKISDLQTTLGSDYAKSDFSNTSRITNTVLEAPNGVADYDSQTINIKSGVKVLIPDGKTSDGNLNNIEYITEDIITKTFTNLSNINTVIFLSDDGTIEAVYEGYVLYKNTVPSTLQAGVHWYNTEENRWYIYDTTSSEWQASSVTPIARASWNASSVISYFSPTTPLNLVKYSDLNDFYTIKGILPKDLDYVVQQYHSSWAFYRVYKSGWVRQGGYTEGNGDSIASFYFPITPGYHVSVVRVSGISNTSNIGVWIREVTSSYVRIYSNGNTGKVWSVEGYMSTREEV